MGPRVARLEVLRDVLSRVDETFQKHARGVNADAVIPLEELPTALQDALAAACEPIPSSQAGAGASSMILKRMPEEASHERRLLAMLREMRPTALQDALAAACEPIPSSQAGAGASSMILKRMPEEASHERRLLAMLREMRPNDQHGGTHTFGCTLEEFEELTAELVERAELAERPTE